MMNKVISEGNKVELHRISSTAKAEGAGKEIKTYVSLVTELIDENRMKITMPIESGRVVPLPVNGRFCANFYTDKGLYQARIMISDRYKEGNIYILVIELISDLMKFQRRQYYRLACTMNIWYCKLEEGEEMPDIQGNNVREILNNRYKEGTALDISGGGIRFVSHERLTPGDTVYIVLDIKYGEKGNQYGLNGKVISSGEVPGRPENIEHRVEYMCIEGKVRESLIRYIFEEERRQRQKELDD